MTRSEPNFLFATCQRGAEPALKHELALNWPDFRFAYSRPGFLTFKLPAGHQLREDFDLRSVFARAYGFCLAKIAATDPAEAARQVWQVAAELAIERLHVWQRDLAEPGFRGYEPAITPEALAVRDRILAAQTSEVAGVTVEPTARPGQLVLDCVIVEPDEWWIGYHRAHSAVSCYPGGLSDLKLPPEVVSRAYLKMEEVLRWSQLPIRAGERCVEIGSAPGGASQALLSRGLRVTGIDPAAMHPTVLGNPHFTHIRKRGHEVRRREFRKTRWLVADMNVAPTYALDTVESIVTHPEVDVRGLLLTLKLLEWQLAEEIPAYVERIHGWGYDDVRVRQLQYNRQEVCVTAQRRGKIRG